MEESNDHREDLSDSKLENGENTSQDLTSLKQINCKVGIASDDAENQDVAPPESLNPLKPKGSSTGTKPKRKVRSTRRRLNAMMSNSSLHFSDTDSEGELTMISGRSPTIPEAPQGPVITLDPVEDEPDRNEYPNCLSPGDKDIPRSSSFTENLTDIDEIYPSDPENEAKESRNSLTLGESPLLGDTDLEDLEVEDEVQSTIYVNPRSDILTEFSGETIMTTEGDGPFSVEVRNKMSREQVSMDEAASTTPDILVEVNTDEEDMDASDEEEMEEACCSQKMIEDFNILSASQIVNVSKMENLSVKDPVEETTDCHTDVEDVDMN